MPTTVRDAYIKLKTADNLGGNVTNLAEQFNLALTFFGKASDLERAGNNTGADALTKQGQQVIQDIPTDAQNLANLASSQKEQQNRLQIILIPIAALVVAIAAVSIIALRRWVVSKQFLELGVQPVEGLS